MCALTCVPRQRHSRHGLLLTNAKKVSECEMVICRRSHQLQSRNIKKKKSILVTALSLCFLHELAMFLML